MTKPSIPLGLVFSRTGPYAMMSGEMQKSALMAVDEVNQSEEFDFSFAPHWRDPGGVVAAYHTACDDLIREEQVEHIVGGPRKPDRTIQDRDRAIQDRRHAARRRQPSRPRRRRATPP